MSDEAKVRDLFATMQETPIDVEGGRFKVDRERIVATILAAPKALEIARARRSQRHAILAMAAGFAVLIGAGGWLLAARPGGLASSSQALQISDARGQVTHTQGASQMMIAPGASSSVSPDGELATAASSEVTIHTVAGLEMKLFENSRVSLSDLKVTASAIAVHLGSGAIRCRVPHLAEGQRFSVITPDATVVVHGTTFRVAVGGMVGASRTCVHVEEGVVSVEGVTGETRLSESQSWGCGAEQDSPLPAVPTLAPAAAPSTHPPPSRVATEPAKDYPKAPPGTLNEENRLFQSGLAAERKGDIRTAMASFELLLTRYPQSPLASDARAALARVDHGAKGAH